MGKQSQKRSSVILIGDSSSVVALSYQIFESFKGNTIFHIVYVDF